MVKIVEIIEAFKGRYRLEILYVHDSVILTCKTGKAFRLQAWSGPEVSRKLRLPDFMTTAQDGGKCVRLKHRPSLPQGNAPGTHFC